MVEKTRYSKEELKEFELIIEGKLEEAYDELKKLKAAVGEENENLLNTNIKVPDNSAEIEQRDSLGQLALHQYKFIQHLERALERIKQGTYGVCVVTGQLIGKERLRLVPHTTHSLVAKQRRNSLGVSE